MKTLFLLLAILLGPSFAIADLTDISADEFTVAAPPEEGSRAFTKDYEELLDFQNGDRTKECKLAKKQRWPEFMAFFGDAEILTDDQLEEAKTLVGRAMKFSVNITTVFKAQYMRARPYDVDSRIEPCAQKPGGSKSYPSSHAVAALVGSCVLGAIYPSKAEKLHDYGIYLGDVRMIVGVHHPSDVRAGQKLGQKICDRLLKDDDFKREIKALK